MSARLPAIARACARQSQLMAPARIQSRSFQSSGRLLAEVAPVKKPVGAFRGGIFGFLFGSVATGAGMYYYVMDEYRASNELLTEDIYALQAAVHRIEEYVKKLEDKVYAKK